MNANERDIDVVQILLHPNNAMGDTQRLERVKREMQHKENKELTLQPKTLSRRNEKLLANQQSSMMSTGDRNVDLYLKSKNHEKRNKDSEEYWFERNADELRFQPEVNNQVY